MLKARDKKRRDNSTISVPALRTELVELLVAPWLVSQEIGMPSLGHKINMILERHNRGAQNMISRSRTPKVEVV